MLRLIPMSLLFGFSLVAHAAPVHYNVDTAKSVVEWKAAKVAGPHNGTVKLKDGQVTLENGAPQSGNFTLDFTTITDLDLTDAEWKNKLETHLKSDDFFNTPKYPTGTFVLKSAKPSKVAGEFTVTGDLTIKGKTKEISFPAKVAVVGTTATAKADFKINRLDYDIKYNSKAFFDAKKLGDKLIYDDIELKLDLVANAGTAPVAAQAPATTKPTKVTRAAEKAKPVATKDVKN